MIRLATDSDLRILPDIERAAGTLFEPIGMSSVAEHEPVPVDTLRVYQQAGRAWVWGGDGPIGYLLVSALDASAHIDQVSVRPEWAGRRIGKQLIDRAVCWAAEEGMPAVTLTTFTEVPWNGPYYARLGFRYLSDAEQTPGLCAVRAAERARGLDRWPRACMRAELAEWALG
ncbi:GNAT family N-acetyltransferase [Nocardia sp. CNY236]|uniref:GNAT family N-acetyltransferase n=1 Tax=Nocardia sp. CNY236 TaxID=1169152 RepID=UPI00048B9AB5|nr:GNAT family N-acetyltransferase [Nocardia sp. CNY236]